MAVRASVLAWSLVWSLGAPHVAVAGVDPPPPADENPFALYADIGCFDLLVVRTSYALAPTAHLAEMLRRRRAALLAQFFGERQLFRSEAFAWALAREYLNTDDLRDLDYDRKPRGSVFLPGLGVQPARRYYESLVAADPERAARAVWKTLQETFDASFLIVREPREAAAGEALQHLRQRLDETRLEPEWFFWTCRQVREIRAQADDEAIVVRLLQQMIPQLAPIGLRHHHARLLALAGETTKARKILDEAEHGERELGKKLEAGWRVDLAKLEHETVLIDPFAAYPEYVARAAEYERLVVKVADDELSQLLFGADIQTALTRLAGEIHLRGEWLTAPVVWSELRELLAMPSPAGAERLLRAVAVVQAIRAHFAIFLAETIRLDADAKVLAKQVEAALASVTARGERSAALASAPRALRGNAAALDLVQASLARRRGAIVATLDSASRGAELLTLAALGDTDANLARALEVLRTLGDRWTGSTSSR